MVYFLSDAHLGSLVMEDPAEHQNRVVRLLDRMAEDATEIYLLGDIFDYWYEYFWGIRYKMDDPRSPKHAYLPTLQALKRLTDKGVDVHFYIGNHDIWTFGWLGRETGMIIHKKPEVRTIQGKRVYLGHGDGIAPSDVMQRVPKDFQRRIRRFMLLRRIFHNPIPQQLFRLMPVQWGDQLGYNWAKNSRLKEIANPCGYKGEDKEELVLFAKEQEQYAEQEGRRNDYYIFGHRHIELDLMIQSGSRVVILGDYFQQWTYAKMDEQGQLILENDAY